MALEGGGVKYFFLPETLENSIFTHFSLIKPGNFLDFGKFPLYYAKFDNYAYNLKNTAMDFLKAIFSPQFLIIEKLPPKYQNI